MIKTAFFNLIVAMLLPFILITGCTKEEQLKSASGHSVYTFRDIEYAVNTDTSGQQQHLLFDLYVMRKTAARQKLPLVLMIHGGGYQIGNKQWVSTSCEVMARAGFIAASIDYRLGWRTEGGCYGDSLTLSEAAYRGMQDANAALRFLVAHADEYGIDTSWIFIGGESAGAAIALNSCYSSDHEIELHHPELQMKLGKLSAVGNNLTETYTIKGICNKWGAISDTNLLNPNHLIPVISFHGGEDELVPADKGYFLGCGAVPAFGSVCINRRMQELDGISILYLSQNAGHQPGNYSPEFAMGKTAEFFLAIMNKRAESGVYVE